MDKMLKKIDLLNEIGISLSVEKNNQRVLEIILTAQRS